MNERQPPPDQSSEEQPPEDKSPEEQSPKDQLPEAAPAPPAFTWEAPGSQEVAAAPSGGRPMTVGDIFERWIWVYRTGFLVLLGVAAVIQVPLAFLGAALGQRILDAANPLFALGQEANPSPQAVSDALGTALPALIGAGAAAIVIGIVAAVLLQPALIETAARIHTGSPAMIEDAYRAALRAALPIFLGSIAVGLAMLGLLIAIVGGGAVLAALLSAAEQDTLSGVVIFLAIVSWLIAALYVVVRWAVWSQAVVLERRGPIEALGRSWRLVKGSMWRTVGVIVAVGIITAIADGILGVVSGIVVGSLGNAWVQAISQVLAVFTVSWSPIVLTLLFFDLRARQETAPTPSEAPPPAWPTVPSP